MSPRDIDRRWGRARCAQLGRLDRADGIVCPVCKFRCGVANPPRKALLTRDHWLLLFVLVMLAVMLTGAYGLGQTWRCDRLTAAGDSAAATYCPEETR